ncbi:MAG: histidine--tRNA ligase [Cyclobacteriaceae bacterium]|nr:histidine--tRNA ligase [Cyclobacteriaceae bacterium]
MTTAPKLPKGTRDFPPEVMLKRNYIIDTIKTVFKKYGFLPLETPALENLSVLMGKYGEEGDRLLFKILNSGDFLKNVNEKDFGNSTKITPLISEKGLRYDLTVPFARFVAANRHQISFPFKRYQIQPVWRADRPQKGRYREFYQCDADVVGTKSLICEVEIIQTIREVFSLLKIDDYTIKINHREIIRGISEFAGQKGKETELAVAIDKIDKIGWQGVADELTSRGFSNENIENIKSIISIEGELSEKLQKLGSLLENNSGKKGVEEMSKMLQLLDYAGENLSNLEFDISLARGLSYYTGAIFEVKINGVQIGSVSGGGRYDNLTGVFGVEDVPGVGFSFGIDRLFDCMEELNLFPTKNPENTKALLVHFDEPSFNYGLKLLSEIRKSNISAEIYPDFSKLKKQIQYADKKGISYVVFIGSDEINTGEFTVKNLVDGSEQKLNKANLIEFLKE